MALSHWPLVVVPRPRGMTVGVLDPSRCPLRPGSHLYDQHLNVASRSRAGGGRLSRKPLPGPRPLFWVPTPGPCPPELSAALVSSNKLI